MMPFGTDAHATAALEVSRLSFVNRLWPARRHHGCAIRYVVAAMHNATQTFYKDHRIVTRWAPVGIGGREGYRASFTVESTGTDRESWQEFPNAVFPSPADATVNAVEEARLSIDLLAFA